MDGFDLARLTDFDFEAVCKDIFENLLGVDLEIFCPGADRGIDLRHLGVSNEDSIIIQCKHWPRSGKSKLVSHMRNHELPKIKRLKPSRYILATSCELSVATKSDLLSILSPYIRSSSDIFGLDEITSRLRQSPDITRRHLRLWLNSTAILQSLLAKKSLTRSAALLNEIEQTLAHFAPSESFNRAREVLESTHSVVITGNPGVGKTTLAQVLLAEYHAHGYEIVEISSDVDEVNQLWSDHANQVFYYDDFLGQTTLDDKLNKNEDSRLASLLRRVETYPGKRFILTTRGYILEQAKQRYEKISRLDLSPIKYILDLTTQPESVKAQILHNHIYVADIPGETKKIFAEPEIFRPIIDHLNFNPRIVNLSIRRTPVGEPPETTAQRLLEDLQEPRKIWGHVVEYQLDEKAVSVLEVLFTLGGSVPVGSVEKAWIAYVEKSSEARKFRRTVQLLEGGILKVVVNEDGTQLDFHDPSVRDYLTGYLSERPYLLEGLLRKAVFFDQIQALWAISKGTEGSAFRSAFINSPSLRESISATLHNSCPREKKTLGLTFRCWVVVDIAEEMSSREIFEIAESALNILDMEEDEATEDEMSRLINRLASCSFPAGITHARRLLGPAIDYITEDTSSWELKEYASYALQSYDKISDPEISAAVRSAASSIEDDLYETATIAFEAWDTGDPMNVYEMKQIVEYASSYINPSEYFENYEAIAAEVTLTSSHERTENTDSNSGIAEVSAAQIMSFLKNE